MGYAAFHQDVSDRTGHAVSAVEALADLIAEVVIEIQVGQRDADADDDLDSERPAGDAADDGDFTNLPAAACTFFIAVAEVAEGGACEHGDHQNAGQQGPGGRPVLRDNLYTGLPQNLGTEQQPQKPADDRGGNQEFAEQRHLGSQEHARQQQGAQASCAFQQGLQ